ncbi:FAD binding domain protein, partial [Plectosphaerella plurivora]
FKVVIVGAGIAGLTLASILEEHDLDYVLLEKHSSVVCEVGASIGLFPHGLRILDQLGIYEAISEFLEGQPSIGQTYIRRADGSILTRIGHITEHMVHRHGYPFLFFDRQDFLRLLYRNLRHKERVIVNKAVSDISLFSNGAQVSCTDGSSYDGTLVVGADGVHSSVRRIMRSLAAKVEPGYFDPKEEGRVPCFYQCSFGIAQHVPGWPKGDQQMVTGDQLSQLVVTGPDEKIYWFLFERLSKPKRGADIPRYTKDDEKEFFAKHWDLPITEHITFGDVVKKRISSALTPLHEVVYKRWHFGRIITIGDSAHKPNPISGHGGNIAIEACADLINALMRVKDRRGGNLDDLSTEEISGAFHEVESTRLRRSKTVVKAAHHQQALFACESPIMSYIVNNIAMPRLGSEQLLSRNGAVMLGGPRIKSLSVPRRARAVPFNDELPAKRLSNATSALVWRAFLTIMIAALFLSFIWGNPSIDNGRFLPFKWLQEGVSHPAGTVPDRPSEQMITERFQLYYSSTQLTSPLLVYLIEGNRIGNQLTPLAFPVLISSALQFQGVIRVAAVYAILVHLFSHSIPTGRPVSLQFADALVPSLIIAWYIIPALLLFMPLSNSMEEFSTTVWHFSPILFIFLTKIIALLLGQLRRRPSSTNGAVQTDALVASYQNQDVRRLKLAYRVAFWAQSLSHLAVHLHTGVSPITTSSLGLKHVLDVVTRRSSSTARTQKSPAPLGPDVAVAALVFLCSNLYSVWDVRRVGYVKTNSAVLAAALVLLGWLAVGPGATWAALWYWRENIISSLA